MVDTNPASLPSEPLPHSKGLPLVGDTLNFVRSPHDYIQSQQRKHSRDGTRCPMFSSNLLTQKVHIACSETLRQHIQQQPTTYTHTKAYDLIGFQRFYGTTLLTSDDEQYVQQVKTLFETAFSAECMREYVKPTVTHFCHMTVKPAVGQIANSQQPTPLYATIKDLLPTLLFTLLFSSTVNTVEDDLQQMLDTLHTWSKLTFQGSIALPIKWLPLNLKSAYAQGQHAKQEFEQWVTQRITTRLTRVPQLNESHDAPTLFDRLLLQIHTMSQDAPSSQQNLIDIAVAHLSLFISALIGKALSSIITTTMEQMVTSNDAQKYVEQIRSEATNPDFNQLSDEQLQQMQTLDIVIREVERMYPPILGVPRYSHSDVTQGTLPNSSHVWISYYSAGHDGTCYDNADKFDPTRWKADNTEQGQLNTTGHHLAFGWGSRSCMGQALSLLIAKSVVLQLITTADWQIEAEVNRKYKYIPVYRAVNDLHVTCRLLNTSTANDVE